MRQVAKLFKNGRSQAVRLPSAFRFDCEEVYIRKNPATGDMILSKRPGTWEEFFKLVDSLDLPKDFMNDRDNDTPQKRELF